MKHELVEVCIQIIMPMREWYIIFCNQDNLNKYSSNEFTLHDQGKIEIDYKQQKSLTIPDRWTTQDITSAHQYGSSFNKIKTFHVRGNYYDNICGTSQEEIYNLDLWIFPMNNKIEEAIFTFESIIIQQVQGVQSGRWSMEQIIYDKLNLTTDLPNTDHKPYLNTILKEYGLIHQQ
ncbi:unnamed protein product [Adineta steineri]|uniref:Uncharacterized protein n=1 Tax=Adineta steineri TaxID=433720 RepID=A0A815P280_9BILA|nr:unnamed protein product [Adineta steineri]